MAHTVIGTAGHIDHGKTLLVKRLTGVDTDRAPEERARGITIELGFAFFGDEATIIDVPGHERFVKTMVAGVSTIDLAILVIAADDGVMPQSREHLDVLQVLGVRRGVIALNKVDLVDDEWLDLVEEDIAELVAGTFLEKAPVHRVSAANGEGVEALESTLLHMVRQTEEKRGGGPFRLPVDRAFVVKGFGMVCTGTVLSGRLAEGDPVELLPHRRELRVRGLQRHGEAATEVAAGDRAALNLPGLEPGDIQRGDVVSEVGCLSPTQMLDVRLELLASAPRELRQRTRVRVHVGTCEAMARVGLLEADVLRPGESGLVQLRLETPVAAAWGDRLAIRRYSPPLTIGGGRVLAVHPPRHRQMDAEALARLADLDRARGRDVVEPAVRLAPGGVIGKRRLAGELGLGLEEVAVVAHDLEADGRLVEASLDQDECLVHAEVWTELRQQIEDSLARFHAEHPLETGMNREGLRQVCGRGVPSALFDSVLGSLEQDGRTAADGAQVRLQEHRIQLSRRQEDLRSQVETALRAADLTSMPDSDELARRFGADSEEMQSLLAALERLGSIVRPESQLLLHSDTLAQVQSALRCYLEAHGEITVSQFREQIGSNRRYALALLNRFDAEGFTQRRGDVRVLRPIKP